MAFCETDKPESSQLERLHFFCRIMLPGGTAISLYGSAGLTEPALSSQRYVQQPRTRYVESAS
jgi:hypothetical protein